MTEIKNVKSKRNAREIKLDLESDNFKGSFGTLTKNEPNVVYIKLLTWMKHTDAIYEYPEHIEHLKKKIKIKFGEYADGSRLFASKIFYNLESKTVLVTADDCFHGSFEFTIKQNEPIESDLDVLKPVIEKLCNKIINAMEVSAYFDFKYSKK